MAPAAEPRKKLRVGIYKLSWIVFKNQYAYDLQLVHLFPYSIIKKRMFEQISWAHHEHFIKNGREGRGNYRTSLGSASIDQSKFLQNKPQSTFKQCM